MENIDIKKVIIAILILVILVIGAIFGIKALVSNKKEYILEKISEEDCKYFSVYTNEKYGVLNEKGEEIIETKYLNITIPNQTKAVFICEKEDGTIEIINEKKEELFSNQKNVQAIGINGITTNFPYEKSVLKYEEKGKFGLINYEGKVITKPIYDEISSLKYKEGEILAKKDGKYGVINSNGVELIPFEYEEIEGDKYYGESYEKSGYIVKKRTNDGYRYGYISNKWKKLLNVEYTDINRILDIDSDDIYLIASKNRTIWTYKKQK